MAKRITQQARGKGSMTFRVRPRAYRHKISYPSLRVEGVGKIINLFNSGGHTSPLAEIEIKINEKEKARFIVPAAEGVYGELDLKM